MAVGKPRTDAYLRLLHRLHEPLTLLKMALGEHTLGPHLVNHHEPANLDATRRRLLRNLAYTCDFSKGGKSVASIGAEERDDCFVLWLALNENYHGRGVAILRDTLECLREVIGMSDAQRPDGVRELLRRCAGAANRKIVKEAKCLSSSAANSIKFSEDEGGRADLITWIRQFEYRGSAQPLEMCALSYSNRHTKGMRLLDSLIRNLSDAGLSQSAYSKHLSRVKHFIGRLAQHIRSAYELVEDGSRLAEFVRACRVESVPLPTCAPAPPSDNHTNLQGMLRRMVRPHETERWSRLTESLDIIRKVLPDDDIKEEYDALKPRVHSEVQVLEHFHRHNLKFAYNDNFIATSKMSCLCCQLYFRHHPLRCGELEAHGKVYQHWGLAFLPDGCQDPDFRAQRDVMNKLIEAIREETISRLLELNNLWSFHPDSISGVTPLGRPGDLETSDSSGAADHSDSHQGELSTDATTIAGDTHDSDVRGDLADVAHGEEQGNGGVQGPDQGEDTDEGEGGVLIVPSPTFNT